MGECILSADVPLRTVSPAPPPLVVVNERVTPAALEAGRTRAALCAEQMQRGRPRNSQICNAVAHGIPKVIHPVIGMLMQKCDSLESMRMARRAIVFMHGLEAIISGIFERADFL